MLRYLILLVLIVFVSNANAQEKATLNGYVKDAENGEELIGVTVYIPALKAGTVTNDYGFYAINLPRGTYEVQFSYMGYQLDVQTVDLNSDVSLNINLKPDAQLMQEIVIEEKPLDENVIAVQMSKNTINMNRVKKLPALFGEIDIIKNIQMLPGVITAGEGTSTYFVRGGSADQNLLLIDEAPVYDPLSPFRALFGVQCGCHQGFGVI
jgi:hypothetical protein